MVKRIHPLSPALALTLGLACSACGVEGLFFGGFDDDNQPPATTVNGTMSPALAKMDVVLANGEAIAVASFELASPGASESAYALKIPSNDYQNLRLTANEGDLAVSTLVAQLGVETTTNDVRIDAATQTASIIIDAALSKEGRNLQNIEPATLLMRWGEALASLQVDGPAKQLHQMVERLLAAGARTSTKPRMFRIPVVTPELEVTTSALNPDWMALTEVDYDGDMMVETGSTAVGKFDDKLREVLGAVINRECIDPVNIRVVFEVDFNGGRLDGNCDAINRFRWVVDAPGKSMFFVGGIHEESPIQNPELDASMGNVSGWTPNTIPMFDDGTNGDEAAGDNVWTITFSMPRGTRVGYKYTWGIQGQLWTGSEEWPGNQHILEIVDVNGDNFVRRHDNFGDEATNKDKVNLNRRGNGTVTWDTDVNGDDIPDAQERPLDPDNNCTADGWATPAAVGPVTIPCQ